MIGIALHLRRPSFVTLDQQALRLAAERHRRGKKERPTRNFLLRLTYVGNNQLFGLRRARASDTGERERRAHQFQEAAATDRVDPLGGVFWKLAMQVLLKLGGLGDFLEALPVLLSRHAAKPRADRGDVGFRHCPLRLFPQTNLPSPVDGRPPTVQTRAPQLTPPRTAPHLVHLADLTHPPHLAVANRTTR